MPGIVRGHVIGLTDSQLPVQLAVAVNGRIYGTTRTYTLDGHKRLFHLMLPEEAVTEEDGRVEVFELLTVEGSIRLRETR